MDTSDLRYLYRKQESTGIWIQEHGPFVSAEAAEHWRKLRFCDEADQYVVGICTSEDGRTVITEYQK